VSKHTPMVPAARAELTVVRAWSEVGVGPSWLSEVVLALGRADVGARGGRAQRLSNRTVRYRVRAVLRLWRAMW
jgi:hypothetical protein